MAWHDLSQQAVERRCEVTMTAMVNGDGDETGGDDDDDFDDGDGDNDGDDDHDDDHFNTGLRRFDSPGGPAASSDWISTCRAQCSVRPVSPVAPRADPWSAGGGGSRGPRGAPCFVIQASF